MTNIVELMCDRLLAMGFPATPEDIAWLIGQTEDAGNHARQIQRAVERCPHAKEQEDADDEKL